LYIVRDFVFTDFLSTEAPAIFRLHGGKVLTCLCGAGSLKRQLLALLIQSRNEQPVMLDEEIVDSDHGA